MLNSTDLQLVVPAGPENPLLPLPAVLVPQLVDRANRPSTVVGTNLTPARTDLEQDSYTLDLLPYVQQVLAGTLNNNGLLPNPCTSAATTNRAVLGNAANTEAPLQLKIYYTRVVQWGPWAADSQVVIQSTARNLNQAAQPGCSGSLPRFG